jgi:hypothetical protein
MFNNLRRLCNRIYQVFVNKRRQIKRQIQYKPKNISNPPIKQQIKQPPIKRQQMKQIYPKITLNKENKTQLKLITPSEPISTKYLIPNEYDFIPEDEGDFKYIIYLLKLETDYKKELRSIRALL